MKHQTRDAIIIAAFVVGYLSGLALLLLFSDVRLAPETADRVRSVLAVLTVAGLAIAFAARWIPVREPS